MQQNELTPWDLIDPETSKGKSAHKAVFMSRVGLRHKVMRRVSMRVLGMNTEAELDRYLAVLAIEHVKKIKPELYNSIVNDLMENPEGFIPLMAANNSEDGASLPSSYKAAVEAAISKQKGKP